MVSPEVAEMLAPKAMLAPRALQVLPDLAGCSEQLVRAVQSATRAPVVPLESAALRAALARVAPEELLVFVAPTAELATKVLSAYVARQAPLAPRVRPVRVALVARLVSAASLGLQVRREAEVCVETMVAWVPAVLLVSKGQSVTKGSRVLPALAERLVPRDLVVPSVVLEQLVLRVLWDRLASPARAAKRVLAARLEMSVYRVPAVRPDSQVLVERMVLPVLAVPSAMMETRDRQAFAVCKAVLAPLVVEAAPGLGVQPDQLVLKVPKVNAVLSVLRALLELAVSPVFKVPMDVLERVVCSVLPALAALLVARVLRDFVVPQVSADLPA